MISRPARRAAPRAGVVALLRRMQSTPALHTVAVFAAASLRSTFTDLSGAFTGANTGAKVELTFAAPPTR